MESLFLRKLLENYWDLTSYLITGKANKVINNEEESLAGLCFHCISCRIREQVKWLSFFRLTYVRPGNRSYLPMKNGATAEMPGLFLAAPEGHHCPAGSVVSIVPGMMHKKAERGPRHQAHAHLVFLLEAVALSTLHLRDVLKQVCYSDGGVKLPGLVGHVSRLALLVRVGLHQAAGVTGHRVSFI